MLHVRCLELNPFQEQTYIVFNDNKDCIIVDPGCSKNTEEQAIVNLIEQENLNPVALINTHCHIDHIFGNAYISEKYNLPLQMHQLDLPTLNLDTQTASMYGLNYTTSPRPEIFLKEGSDFNLGADKLEIRFAPGHAPGHIILVAHKEKFVIGGDVIFRMSIGRTDLPGGDHQTLLDSISREIYSLDDDYTIHPGHGPTTTVGFEKTNNPFVKG